MHLYCYFTLYASFQSTQALLVHLCYELFWQHVHLIQIIIIQILDGSIYTRKSVSRVTYIKCPASRLNNSKAEKTSDIKWLLE